MDSEQKNGNTVLLTVIGVATLLVALVGATFAYFSANITNTADHSVIITTAAPVGLIYKSTGDIEATNIIPGESITPGTFTVRNPDGTGEGETIGSTVMQTYDLNLIVDEDTFNTNDGPDQLELKVTVATDGNGKNGAGEAYTTSMKLGSSGTTWNMTDGDTISNRASAIEGTSINTDGKRVYNIVNDQLIAIGETHTYTIAMEFKESGSLQDQNQGKSFKAHVEISDPVSVKDDGTSNRPTEGA